MESQIIRKLTPKSILAGDVKRFLPKNDKGEIQGSTVALYHILGQAADVRRGESTYGPWAALVGRFEAVRVVDDPEGRGAVTGESITAPECFLPEPINTLLVQTLSETRVVLGEDKKPIMETVYDTVETTDSKGVKTSQKVGRQIEKRERVTESVEFVFEIGIKAAKTATGYEYVVGTLVKPESADPLVHLREKRLALTGPKSAEAEDKPAPSAARRR